MGAIKSRVAQGSVLDTLLFLIYLNYIIDVVKSEMRLFAEDTTLFIDVLDHTTAAESLNSDMVSINEWSNNWLVTFNPVKPESMIISKKRKAIHPTV